MTEAAEVLPPHCVFSSLNISQSWRLSGQLSIVGKLTHLTRCRAVSSSDQQRAMAYDPRNDHQLFVVLTRIILSVWFAL